MAVELTSNVLMTSSCRDRVLNLLYTSRTLNHYHCRWTEGRGRIPYSSVNNLFFLLTGVNLALLVHDRCKSLCVNCLLHVETDDPSANWDQNQQHFGRCSLVDCPFGTLKQLPTMTIITARIGIGTALVAQWVRALAPQAEGSVFESKPQQTLVGKTESDISTAKQ